MTSSAIRHDHLVRPRHVVTAVLVAHDGARWLPTTLHAVKTQRRPVQRFVAVDTGSRDDTRQLLERSVGASSVIAAPRDAGFGAAVNLALAAFAGVPGLASTRSDAGAPVEWLWLLHDDGAPSATALEAMLELADEMPSVAVIGPKLRGWDDRGILLEVGVTLDRGGRRETGLEPGELDHGQHDGARDVLAVSSAGMLVRRDVWDELGGFDPALPLFRDDVDFGWRANLAGHRVVVCSEALVRHAEAAASGARRIAAGASQRRRLDRQGALWTMLANGSRGWLPWIALRLMLACVVRAGLFVVTKRPFDAWDELRAAATIFAHPMSILRARRARRANVTLRNGQIRGLFAPRGTRLRHYADSLGERLSAIGRRDDEVVDDRSLLRRIVTQPALLLFVALLVISLVAERHVLSGTLYGGALLPAPVGASDLWHTYTASWHDTGFGSTAAAPAYLALLAAFAVVLFGSAQLAVQVLLLGCVPLAGMSAYVAARSLAPTKRLRVWLAATYALLPVATGAVAGGRLGTAVAFIVLPVILSSLANALLPPLARGARTARIAARRAGRRVAGVRPAWTAALALAVATAFDPLVYALLAPLLVVALLVALLRRSWLGVRRAIVVLAVPPALLLPWSARLIHHPALLVLGVGQPSAQLQSPRLRPVDVLLLHPGGPGMPPVWLYGVVLLAGLAGLLQLTRPGPARLGWLLALTGLAGGYLIARARVTPLGPDPSVAGQLPGWPGSATALIGAGVLMSVAVAGARLRARLTTTDFGWRQPLAVVLAAAAGLVPLIAAEQWVSNGTGGLLRAGATEALPAFVIAEAAAHDQPRTVVLRPGAGDTVAYSLLRDRSPQLGDADLPPDPGYVRIVDTAVAELAGGLGQRAATDLAHAGIRFVLLPSADASLGQRIAGAGGLVPQNTNAGWQVWRVQQDAGRLAIAVRGDDAWQVPTSITTVRGRTPVVHVPYAAGTRLLALAEAPSPAWRALIGSRNGHGGTSLPRTTAAGLQAFTLPPTAADVVVSRLPDRRADWLTFQLIALGVVLLAAIPGGRRANEQQQLRHDERLKTALPVGAVA